MPQAAPKKGPALVERGAYPVHVSQTIPYGTT